MFVSKKRKMTFFLGKIEGYIKKGPMACRLFYKIKLLIFGFCFDK